MAELEELKGRARSGDKKALQELRNRGFFQKKRAAREGYVLSHAQKRLWILDQMEDTPWAYNMPGGLFLFNIHHIVCDGWSMDVLVQELATLYGAFLKGVDSPLPSLKIQYKDYAAWHNALLDSLKIEVHRQYWHRKFSEEPALLHLPTDSSRPAVRTFHGKTLFFTLNPYVSSALETIGRQHQASLFMTLLAWVKTLLYRYTGQKDIVIGTPVAARDQGDLEHQIGFYVNTLALRDRLSAQDGFIQVLEKVKTRSRKRLNIKFILLTGW